MIFQYHFAASGFVVSISEPARSYGNPSTGFPSADSGYHDYAEANNVITTYSVNLSSEPKIGTWRLQVRDVYATDTGYLNSWSITL